MALSRRIPDKTSPDTLRGPRRALPIESASWIAHPEATSARDSFCDYILDFELPEHTTVLLHTSADQRFELFCDGEFIGMGPDRSTPENWSYHVYEIALPAGTHTLRAEVQFMPEAYHPAAQLTMRPGFILHAENSPVSLSTGRAPWKARLRGGITLSLRDIVPANFVGPQFTIDAAEYFRTDTALVDPVVVAPGGAARRDVLYGIIPSRWRLAPSCLPEQMRRSVSGGCIRMVRDQAPDAPLAETPAAEATSWQALVSGKGPVTVPARTRVVVLWDLEQYYTAYPELTLSGGNGARIEWQWAESCYDAPRDGGNCPGRHKGHRDGVAGKQWVGFGDTFLPDGTCERTFRPPWWRAGRYVRLVAETQDEPLTIEGLRLLETRLPLENEGLFDCSDASLKGIIPLAVRGIQACAHETYMDCPYYEQLMYVGDTRLQMLTSFVMSAEDRLNRRAIELFDRSRQDNGFVRAHFPGAQRQFIPTFSMIYPLMLRDYAWWRADADFITQHITGMRQMLEAFRALQADEPLFRNLPGWPFMDWVPEWTNGNPPDALDGASASINLLFLNTLEAAAELETAFGSAQYAEANRIWAGELAAAVQEHFWDARRGLFADDRAHTRWSEHAQCLAILSGLFPAEEQICFERLIRETVLSRTSIYFSFYLFEALARFGRGDLILERMAFWKDLIARGCRTPIESPDPARSDCHAWGSHPLFHFHASLAGIRPDAPGFTHVRIAPLPGPLTRLSSSIPHPAGTVTVAVERCNGAWSGAVSLPRGVPGTFVWQDREYPVSGTTTFALPE
mgnify:CR=1 FL=1